MKTILRKILFVQIFCSLYTINAQTWSQIGPLTWPNNSNNLGWSNGLGNGQITSIWIDPNNSNHALIGGFSGGIFETTNLLSNNVTWTPKTSNIPLHTI